jgi:hypothetical protein
MIFIGSWRCGCYGTNQVQICIVEAGVGEDDVEPSLCAHDLSYFSIITNKGSMKQRFVQKLKLRCRNQKYYESRYLLTSLMKEASKYVACLLRENRF